MLIDAAIPCQQRALALCSGFENVKKNSPKSRFCCTGKRSSLFPPPTGNVRG